jgi:hypothetical protein
MLSRVVWEDGRVLPFKNVSLIFVVLGWAGT